MNQQVQKPAHEKELLGHPVGLYILFFTELWERFSYYGMRALLTLYMYTSLTPDAGESGLVNSGLGWDEGMALSIYGWYTMAVYVMSIPGGIIADRWLGQRKTVMLGGFLLCIGHGILAIDSVYAFIAGLVFIVLGVGGLKPNISTMVGGLYKDGDVRRDPGFTIFYIGINVGAFLAALIVGGVGETWGWHYGFGLAGIGMLVGQTVFIWGQKYLGETGKKVIVEKTKENAHEESGLGSLYAKLLKSPVQLLITILIGGGGLYWALSHEHAYGYESYAYSTLFVFIALAVGMLMMIYKDLLKIERDRFAVVLLSFIIVIVFWGAFEQAGGLMNIYTNEKIDRSLLGWTVPTSWFQSLNPFYIIILGTLVAGYWVKRQLKGKEASTLFKMAVGTMIMGAGYLMMSGATMQVASDGQAGMYWLVFAYLLHTIGELCASPTALSFITKLAPVKYGSLMMGTYFAATGLGNKVAGVIGEGASDAGELETFTGIFIFCAAFGLLLLLFLKKLKALTHGAEDIIEDTHHEEAEGFEIADRE